MFTALFTAALALASVSAASLSTRATTCETRFAGILAAKAGDGLKSFVLSPRNQIAYVGDGQNPLIAEFQECTSLETAPHNASILTGLQPSLSVIRWLTTSYRPAVRAALRQVLRGNEAVQRRTAVLHHP